MRSLLQFFRGKATALAQLAMEEARASFPSKFNQVNKLIETGGYVNRIEARRLAELEYQKALKEYSSPEYKKILSDALTLRAIANMEGDIEEEINAFEYLEQAIALNPTNELARQKKAEHAVNLGITSPQEFVNDYNERMKNK